MPGQGHLGTLGDGLEGLEVPEGGVKVPVALGKGWI